jgi:hypothetical protein
MSEAIAPKRTPYGFEFGSADVSACAQHRGTTIVRVKTPKATIDVYVTKTGKARVYFCGLEVVTGK